MRGRDGLPVFIDEESLPLQDSDCQAEKPYVLCTYIQCSVAISVSAFRFRMLKRKTLFCVEYTSLLSDVKQHPTTCDLETQSPVRVFYLCAVFL